MKKITEEFMFIIIIIAATALLGNIVMPPQRFETEIEFFFVKKFFCVAGQWKFWLSKARAAMPHF